jgi:Tol biopolymer transport system component
MTRLQGRRESRLALGALALAAVFGLTGIAMPQAPRAPYSADRPLPTPVRFDIPNAVSADDFWHVWHNTFTPDGKTMYFMNAAGNGLEVIVETHFLNGRWSSPEVAPFSGLYWVESPSISPDGLRFFFVKPGPKAADIMVMEKTETGWSEPRSLGAPVNDPRFAQPYVSVAANGNLYFSSNREGGLKLFCSKWSNGEYGAPERLSDAVNGDSANIAPAIAPDESYLVFASGRTGSIGHVDLYVSLRKDGAWTPARNLGPKINSSAYDDRPCISPDGKYLFFTSNRGFADRPLKRPLTYPELLALLHGPENGRTNLYQVDIEAVLSPQE